VIGKEAIFKRILRTTCFDRHGQGFRVLKVLAIAVAPVAAEPIVSLKESKILHLACYLTD